MRVRIGDSSLVEDLLDFLSNSGFLAAVEGSDSVRVSLPPELGRHESQTSMQLFLSVWLELALRAWNDLWPEAAGLVVAEEAPAAPAVSASAARF